MEMFLRVMYFCSFFLYSLHLGYGFTDFPYFYETPLLASDSEEQVPHYEFDRPIKPFEKHSELVVEAGTSPTASVLRQMKWKDVTPKSEIQYLTMFAPSRTPYKPRADRRKRSLDSGDALLESNLEDISKMRYLQPLLRLSRNRENVKTIHLPSSFTPRLGRKRSEEKNNPQPAAISGRAQHVINMNAGTAFTPRLGRSERLYWSK
ncbi:uncharacterized protein LOC118199510 [Stegodyphus dumicola]|uniref:uncharacterized protein LOC118199510 n=1 Tax=Stegodyphus dumicola TaxID=202533 RepID=UPI0015AD4629|nr:uncharacterized protein LOC118199510 [Stegodyphus dumicola]